MVWLEFWTSYQWIAIIVVFISIALLAIIYMLGKAFSNDKMTGWAIEEFYQAFGSILIIALVVFVIGFFTDLSLQLLNVNDFTCNLGAKTCSYTEFRMVPTALGFGSSRTDIKECGGPLGTPCHIAIAQSRVNSMFDIVRFNAADKVVRAGWLRIIKSLSFRIKAPFIGKLGTVSNTFGVGVAFSPFAGIVLLNDSYSNVFEFLTKALQFLSIHNIMFTIIEKVIFPLFLVAGIVLRAVSPFRKLGGLLIAIAVGLYFIYPFMFILQSLIIAPDPDKFPLTFEQFQENIPDVPVAIDGQQATMPNNLITGMFSWFNREVDGKQIDMITYYTFRMVQPGGDLETSSFIGVWIIIPEIIVIYTLILFIKGLSPFFGGDVDIAGLSKLV
jgi:hypothetical protein